MIVNYDHHAKRAEVEDARNPQHLEVNVYADILLFLDVHTGVIVIGWEPVEEEPGDVSLMQVAPRRWCVLIRDSTE